MNIWVATGNIHKKIELSGILSELPGITLKIPSEAGIGFSPEENGLTFLDNALIKAEDLYRLLNDKQLDSAGQSLWRQGDVIIADDSGICVDALDGRPGIYSARYGGPGLNDTDRNLLLLKELGDNTSRKASFVCALVLYYGPHHFFAAHETLEGELVKSPGEARGKRGFGYDPILYIPELGRTVAELADDEKNHWSHRGKAGRAIAKILEQARQVEQ